jgi:hypothetical protein
LITPLEESSMTDLIENSDDQITMSVDTQPAATDADNVFVVLARQAHTRNGTELWTTALGGSVNATFIWLQHPKLFWLAAGFAAVAMYGIWGLADRAIGSDPPRKLVRAVTRDLLIAVRGLAVPAGVLAAIVAVGGFMAAALGGWNH